MCALLLEDPYAMGISVSGYWRDVSDQTSYLEHSPFLADLNNERETKNDLYKQRMISLNKFVLVGATQETVVFPNESELFGMSFEVREASIWVLGDGNLVIMDINLWCRWSRRTVSGTWDWNSKEKVLKMRETPGYLGDWIGLQTLDNNNKLVEKTYVGQHMQWTDAFFNSEILSYFDNFLDTRHYVRERRQEEAIM